MSLSTEERTDQVVLVMDNRLGKINFPESRFEYDLTQQEQTSSGRKNVFVGHYIEFLQGGFTSTTPARAVEFPVQFMDDFGKECASLASANAVGVGPQVFQVLSGVALKKTTCEIDSADGNARANQPGKDAWEQAIDKDDVGKSVAEVCYRKGLRPIILEEDVGVNLDDALFKRADIPGDTGAAARPLSPLGSPERELENAKIKFDVVTQLYNLHSSGMYHRDMRAANICLRRYGNNPEDLRATLIDFELVGSIEEHRIPKAAKPYIKAVFDKGGRENTGEILKINPLEFDLGYLAAFYYELEHETRVAEAASCLLDGSSCPFFTNTGHGYLKVKAIEQSDLDELAAKANLKRVCVEELGSQEAVDLANARVKHGGYLDGRDEDNLGREPLSYILLHRPELVKASYETYKEARIRDGKPIEYESFDEQPSDLQELNFDLFASYPKKLERFGYALARKGEVPANGTPIPTWERLEELRPGVFEEMAEDEHNRWWAMKEKQGWRRWVLGPGETYDDKKAADQQKLNKDMVPYAQLDERTKEYDRKNVRNMFRFLKEIGLVVYRP